MSGSSGVGESESRIRLRRARGAEEVRSVSSIPLFLLAFAGVGFFVVPDTATSPPEVRADRLRVGVFRYRTMVDGAEAGSSTITVRPIPGSTRWKFSNRITGAFSQDWSAVATDRFEPVSARLSFGAAESRRLAFELAYTEGRVKGAAFDRLPPHSSRTVEETVAPDTIDQRIDWAAVMAVGEFSTGQTWTFHVFDPGTGLSRVKVAVEGSEMVTVPAGSFEAVRVVYTIEKNRGPETYTAFVAKTIPRFLVRERFPNGSSIELVAITP